MPALLGPISALLSSFTWAVGTTGYSRLSREHSPLSVNFTRALVALPLFALMPFVITRGWSSGVAEFAGVRPDHWGWFTLSMLASYGLGDTLFLLSTRDLGIPGALAIASAYPIWTTVAGYVFRGETLSTAQCFGVVSTVAGIVMVILNTPRALPVAEPQFGGDPAAAAKANGVAREGPVKGRGVVLALTTSLLWAVNGFAIAQGGRDLSPDVANVVRMILALLIVAAMRLMVRRIGVASSAGDSLVLPLAALKRWYWVFAVEAFGGSYLFMYGLSHSSLAVGSTLSSLAPAISVPVAWLAGLERFSPARTFGIAWVVAGIWLLVAG